ncbi:MAG: radical SAM protein, partial [Planctomycetota bacterium]
MRELNLVPPREGSPGPAPHVPRAACREVRFGGRRAFLDPRTLSAWAAEGPWERAPLTEGHEPEFPPPRATRLGAICLSVTHGCNLACRYCYVRKAHVGERGGDTPAAMPRDVVRRAIGLLGGPGPWRVGFFGGEPMLAWDIVEQGVDLARERASAEGARVRFSITTNGTMVTPQRARFLAKHGFSVIFSLDGPQGLHDRERRHAHDLAGGRAGSYDLAREGLGLLAEAGLGERVTLRATFPMRCPDLRARLEHLNSLADEGLARSVSVEPAWPGRHERSDMTSLEHEYLDA